MRWRLLFCCVALLASCGSSEAPGDKGSKNQRPKNLLLISIDSLRADHVGAYGYQPPMTPHLEVTPNLDQLAAAGTRFDSFWATSSWTLPSHVSLFTGLDCLSHAVHHQRFKIDPQHRTLAEHLQQAGYRCHGVFSGPFLDGRYGFQRGFDVYRSAQISSGELADELDRWRQRRVDAGFPEPTDEEIEHVRRQAKNWDSTGARVNQAALQALDDLSAGERPWFLFLHYYDPHYDYLPEKGDPSIATRFDPQYRGTANGASWYFDPNVRDLEPPFARRIGQRDLEHVVARYDAEIFYTDRQIGSVLSRLRTLGVEQDTVVAVVSDHGDEFFDRGGIGHRSHLYTELTRAVFLLRDPHGVPGTVVPDASSHADVAPVLLGALGVAPWAQPLGFDPRDRPDARHGVFSHLFAEVPLIGFRYMESWRDERFTVVRRFAELDPSTKRLELTQLSFPDDTPAFLVFDRETDPYELRPIPPTSPAYQRAIARMAEDAGRLMVQRSRLPQSGLRDRVAAVGNAQEQANLQALGYESAGADDRLPREFAPLPPIR